MIYKNISKYEKGSQKSIILDSEIYYFESKCNERTDLLSLGFDILSLFLNGIECSDISSYAKIEKYKDWMAYFEFESSN